MVLAAHSSSALGDGVMLPVAIKILSPTKKKKDLAVTYRALLDSSCLHVSLSGLTSEPLVKGLCETTAQRLQAALQGPGIKDGCKCLIDG